MLALDLTQELDLLFTMNWNELSTVIQSRVNWMSSETYWSKANYCQLVSPVNYDKAYLQRRRPYFPQSKMHSNKTEMRRTRKRSVRQKLRCMSSFINGYWRQVLSKGDLQKLIGLKLLEISEALPHVEVLKDAISLDDCLKFGIRWILHT